MLKRSVYGFEEAEENDVRKGGVESKSEAAGMRPRNVKHHRARGMLVL